MEAFLRSAKRPSRSPWTLEEAARFAALKEGYLLQFLSKHKDALATARRLGVLQPQPQPQAPSVAEGGGGSGRAHPGRPAGDSSATNSAGAQGGRRDAMRSASHGTRQPQGSAPAPAASTAAAGAVGRADANTGDGTGGTLAPKPNARKRKSAARSARRHAQRQRPIRRLSLAVLFVTRLRRRARRRREQEDLVEDMRSELLDSGLDPAFHTPEEIAFALFETDVPPPSLALRLGSPLIPLPAKRGRQGGSSSSSDAGSSSSSGVGMAMDHGLAPRSSTRPASKRSGKSRWGPALLR